MELNNNDQYLELLKKVFNTEDGKTLLLMLILRKQRSKLFTGDVNEMIYRAGQHDLIQEFRQGLSADLDEFKESKKFKTFNPLI